MGLPFDSLHNDGRSQQLGSVVVTSQSDERSLRPTVVSVVVTWERTVGDRQFDDQDFARNATVLALTTRSNSLFL